MTDPRRALGKATERFTETDRAHEEARAEVTKAVIAALRAGIGPTEVAALSPFTAAYVRKLARDHGVPPAPVGMKPRTAPRKADE